MGVTVRRACSFETLWRNARCLPVGFWYHPAMTQTVNIVGAGLAGSEAALQLAARGVEVRLFEARPIIQDGIHQSDRCAELVCSNSLKSTKPDSAAGMLKAELAELGSHLYACACKTQVAAGGALAVDREAFAAAVTAEIEAIPHIERITAEVHAIDANGDVLIVDGAGEPAYAGKPADACIIASGPLTSDALACSLQELTGGENLAFYDAAAPIVLADSIDRAIVFAQSRYEEGEGDYLNAPFDKEEYADFIAQLVAADRVILRDFETKDLFQACQPIEEIARKGFDAPRFGPLKPVGLTDPRTGRRPWAALQLRAEDAHAQSFNLVGFQTNLTFPEQKRVFRMIPGLQHAEFARFGVMHRNTFLDAPRTLDAWLRLRAAKLQDAAAVPLYCAGQISGTEGYCEAIRSGLQTALNVFAFLQGKRAPLPPRETAFGALLGYATDPQTVDYQPMHVNFGIMEPLATPIKNKRQRYAAYAHRGAEALDTYRTQLQELGLMPEGGANR